MRTQLRDGETVILELRRHWIVLARAAFWTGLFLVLGIVLLSFSTSVASVIALAVAVCMGLRFAYKLYERKVDLWAVTNRRVIDESGVWSYPVSVDRSGLLAGATPQCFSSYPIGHS